MTRMMVGPTPTWNIIPHAKMPRPAYLSTVMAHLKVDHYVGTRFMRVKLPRVQRAKGRPLNSLTLSIQCL